MLLSFAWSLLLLFPPLGPSAPPTWQQPPRLPPTGPPSATRRLPSSRNRSLPSRRRPCRAAGPGLDVERRIWRRPARSPSGWRLFPQTLRISCSPGARRPRHSVAWGPPPPPPPPLSSSRSPADALRHDAIGAAGARLHPLAAKIGPGQDRERPLEKLIEMRLSATNVVVVVATAAFAARRPAQRQPQRRLHSDNNNNRLRCTVFDETQIQMFGHLVAGFARPARCSCSQTRPNGARDKGLADDTIGRRLEEAPADR